MPISTERFVAEGLHLTYDPYESCVQRITVFNTQCRRCGYEPDNLVSPPNTCPKCYGSAWERCAIPGSILRNSQRY